MALFALILFLYINAVQALEWKEFYVPAWAIQGEDVTLTCDFDPGPDRLYSVKWYKSGREFYRYLPSESLTQDAFRQPGINVDLKESDERHVKLRGITLESSGRYKCEVLTESPLFRTLLKSQDMGVIELPKGPPKVTGGMSEYNPGDILDLNCSSPSSIPPATLTWVMNDQKVSEDYVLSHPTRKDDRGKEISTLGLRLKLDYNHFKEGKISIKCLGKILGIYKQETLHEGSIVTSFPKTLPHDSGANLISISQLIVNIYCFSIVVIFEY